MNANQITYPLKDRWSYLWLAITGFVAITIWAVVSGRKMEHNLVAQ